ncbi:DUF935 domain-containing protein [Achromobacter sp. 2789STDY5608621]|uniref:DUF935 domain-containing protein n=1 Tax=Achromobacter sp. 2789STDY5608621 TaxID=1806496 RepID=UPI0006C84C74|nr:DUF935 domain-containing protein [Achromobacter sp. 2789STDY5608621]
MTQIVDSRGRPMNRDALHEPQTARLGWVSREWAEHPSRGLTPQRLHRILEDAEQGNLVAQADLFSDMEEKDGHIMSEMAKRKRAILTLDWEVHEPINATDEEKRDTAIMRELLSELPAFDEFTLDCMDAVGHGFAPIEVEWHQVGPYTLQRAFHHRPQRWFQTLPHDGNALRLRDGTAHGQELWPLGWVVHQHKARSGYLTRAGLHRTLAWPYLFKNYSVRDLAEFLEIYGLPLRVGKYPAGTTDREKDTLLAAVAGIGHNAAGIIPDSMLIEFESAAEGTQEPFEAMIAWCERTQSKVILGGTLTSQADGKSSTNALGNIHNEVRHDLLVSDARQLAATVNRYVIGPMRALNIAGAAGRRPPEFRFDTRRFDDLRTLSQALPRLVDAGMQIPVDWAHERANIPKPAAGQAVLVKRPTPGAADAAGLAAAASQLGAAVAALTGTAGAAPAGTATAAGQVSRLAAQAAPTMDDWIAKVRDLVDQAKNLQEVRDGLLALAPQMGIDEYAGLLAEALTAAALAGRADILDQARG